MATKRLTWDGPSERLYETGVDRCVLYPVETDGTYPKGVAWNGFMGLSESPSGAEATALYANNRKYQELRSAEEFGGSIKAYTYPDEWEECDGAASVGDGVTIGQQTRKAFGLTYRSLIGNDTEGDSYGYKIHIIYGATASPSSKERETINSDPAALEMEWEFTTNPIDVTGFAKPTSTFEIDSTKAPAKFLTALEDILYGSDTTEARLPLPDEIVTLYSTSKNS